MTPDTPDPQQPSGGGWSLVGAAPEPSAAKDTATPESSWLSSAVNFGTGILSNVNPIEIAKGLYQTAAHPWDTVTGLAKAQVNEFRKAKDAYDQGRYSEMLGHTAAGVLPIVGPAAADIGEAIGTGDNTAYNVGKAVGFAGTMAPGVVAAGAGKLAQTLGKTGIADVAADSAAARVAKAITPEGGANRVRFSNMAQDVGPRLATEPGIGAMTVEGFTRNIGTKLEDAASKLDEAADARNAGRPIDTKPIIDDLKAERLKLTAEPFNASLPERTESVRTSPIVDASGRPIEVTTQTREPMGKDVVPGPNATRVAQIDQAIKEVSALGPQASYDSLKTIRQAYDKVAKVKYSPSITQDFLTKSGEASGAADVTGVLRNTLGTADPATAAANAEYSFWKKSNDVANAAAEIERARPTTGRTIGARLTGAIVGSPAGSLASILGATLGPSIENASRSISGRLIVGRALGSLSEAIRTGDASAIESAVKKVRAVAVPFTAIGKASGGSQ